MPFLISNSLLGYRKYTSDLKSHYWIRAAVTAGFSYSQCLSTFRLQPIFSHDSQDFLLYFLCWMLTIGIELLNLYNQFWTDCRCWSHSARYSQWLKEVQSVSGNLIFLLLYVGLEKSYQLVIILNFEHYIIQKVFARQNLALPTFYLPLAPCYPAMDYCISCLGCLFSESQRHQTRHSVDALFPFYREGL